MAAIPPNALDDDEEDGRCEDLRAKAFLAKRPPRPEKPPPPPLEDEGGAGAGYPPPIFRTMSERIIPRDLRLRSRRIGGRLEKEEKADYKSRKQYRM